MFSATERFTDMPFDLEAMTAEFEELGIDPDVYLNQGMTVLAGWLEKAPMRWLLLGPWWGFVQNLPMELDSSRWAGGDAPPRELSHYTNFEPHHLGLFAVMQNINRNGNTISMMSEPQSIVLADGRNALYSPEGGIIEDE
jgi:hypothetical protein